MTIAITGADGQLGREFRRQLGAEAVGLDRSQLDIAQPEMIRACLCRLRPAAVVNCAAYTLVDRAEDEPAVCQRINADAVGDLADVCRQLDCPLVQISTDYVFGADAQRRTPYREQDPPGPQGVYARSKLAGEQQAARWPRHLVIRTCGLYGASPRGNNFVETMLRLGRERDRLRVVHDQHCTPSFVAHVARATLFLLRSAQVGTWHVVNAGQATWCEFAGEIFRQAGMRVAVEPITTEQFGARAARPRYSVLDTARYQALGGPELPDWRQALAEYLEAVHPSADGGQRNRSRPG